MDKQRALEIIDKIIEGIISSEESFDGEFGTNRSFNELLEDGDVPEDYFMALELKKMIEDL